MHEWPLVGRDLELDQLRRMLSRPKGQGAMLVGAAGMGKTRLAAEFLGLAQGLGFATIHITALRAAVKIPFAAFAPVLAGVRGDVGVDDRAELLRLLAAGLVERAGPRRIVLLVDDAHLLDDASAILVHQLVAANGALVLSTVRTGEPLPDPVLALWKDNLVERIELHGLSRAAIADLLGRALGGPVDQATTTRLAQRCEGNVLFLRELVLGALEDGSLSGQGGLWHQVGPSVPSSRLIDLIETRLAGLEPPQRDMLELVSFAEPLGRAELEAVGDPALAEALERSGLLVSQTNGRRLEIRLAHPLYGDVVRNAVPAVRVVELARSLAEVVENTGARRHDDTLRVATWRLDAGGAQPELMLAAARTARWHFAFPLAERLAHAAVEAGAGFEAKLLAVELADLQGRVTGLDAKLAGLAAEAADDAQRARVAIARLDRLAFHLARFDEALQLAQATEDALSDPAWRDELRARRAGWLLVVRGPRAATDAAEPLLDHATGSAKVWACHVAAHSLGRLGRLQAALSIATDGHAAHRALSTPLSWYPWFHLYHRAEALAHLGRFVEAEQLSVEQYEQGINEGSIEQQAWFGCQLASRVGEQGKMRTAIVRAREAAILFDQLDRPMSVRYCLAHLALAHALAGDGPRAAATLDELDALGVPEEIWVHSGEILQARAWTAAAHGDLAHARAFLDKAATLGRSTGDLIGQAAALHGLARLGHATKVSAELNDLAPLIDGDLAPARAAHTRALATGNAQQLHTASTAFESMGAGLLAAEAAADEALLWRHRGDQRQEAAAKLRATGLAADSQDVHTPALQAIGERGKRDLLTRAERKAATLAAAGRTNREIAEELFLSVRTIESQLHSTYEKLGIIGRRQLPDALKSVGITPSTPVP